MPIPASSITIPGPNGPIPALTFGDCASARAAVILRYGFGGTMTVQWPEAERLVAAGYAVLVPEAPPHGLRSDGLLDRMACVMVWEARAMFFDLVESGSREIRPLVDHLARSGASRFAVAGVSMGGYAALAAPLQDPRVGAVVAFLADPVWEDRPHSPHLHPGAWSHVALLAVTADGDEVVPPGSLRVFAHSLASRFGSGSRFSSLEYRGGHEMDAADWNEAWVRAILWLDLQFP